MARSESGVSGAVQPPKKSRTTIVISKTLAKLPRRQLTLVAITALLNVLLLSSVICIIVAVYQIASDPDDTTSITSEVLTLTSSLSTIAYIVLHTVFSLKQRIWKHQRRHPSILKRTSYIAARVAVTLCILWLLTSGWNMIIVARQPTCLPLGPGLRGWEAGTACRAGRVGMAFAIIALVASCTLFGMLAVMRRPFEAHLLKHGHKPPSEKANSTPSISRRTSPTRSRSASFVSHDRYQGGRISASTFRSMSTNSSNTDVETLDLNSTPLSATILAPSPMRSIGLGIFTSHVQPPPLPPAFATPQSASSHASPPPIFHPSSSHQQLPLPPRMSALVTSSGFVPLSVPAQFSASAWRAVHPSAPSPLGPSTSCPQSHRSRTNSVHSLPYRSRYARSSTSLTRPQRLSVSMPVGSVGWSSKSGPSGPDDDRGSPSSGSDGAERRATAGEIAYAILNGTTIPGTQHAKGGALGHTRQASTPDATAGAQESPDLRPGKIVRSSSADLLRKFSANGRARNPHKDAEKDLTLRPSIEKLLPFRNTRSEAAIQYIGYYNYVPSASGIATIVSHMPQDPKVLKTRNRSMDAVAGAHAPFLKQKARFEDLKNKPLPKIAAL